MLKRSICVLCVTAVGFVFMLGCAAPSAHFGEPMKLADQKPLTVGALRLEPAKYDGQYIAVRGTVKDMCVHSGCWMELAHNPGDTDEGLIVVFTYDRETGRVPPEAKGREALVEGKFVVREMTEGQRRLAAAEQGLPDEEIARIHGSTRMLRLQCPAAEIYGVKPASPKPCEHEEGEAADCKAH